MMLDEIHHISDSRTQRFRTAATQHIKVLSSRGTCVVLCGAHDVFPLLDMTPEMARRFAPATDLEPYDLKDIEGEQVEYRLFLDEVGASLDVFEEIKFGTDDEWFIRMAIATRGRPGTAAALVNFAMVFAEDGADHLNFKSFANAWDRQFAQTTESFFNHLRPRKAARLINPFSCRKDLAETIFMQVVAK